MVNNPVHQYWSPHSRYSWGPRIPNKTKRGLVENMAAKEIAVVFVILSTISPSLSDNVISLTDVDFDDRVFSSSTHFVMFYGPW